MSYDAKREIGMYCDNKSLLISTERGLRRIYCPFKVRAKEDYKSLKSRRIYFVQVLAIGESLITLYQINSNYYPYHLFIIELN